MLHEKAEVTVTATALHHAAHRIALDQATSEAARRAIPRELCELPPAGEAYEEHARGMGTHAATAILALHSREAILSAASLEAMTGCTSKSTMSLQFAIH